ncbi:hypothetical protein ADUPG1_002613 [Aduncisulcus paluster]|uniref:Uncharacterized protein n=2 Tax=Aduncisulcus paluster TaxID=2918883 RepID=A0ABQ5KP65_9EUKA|nr:hypothetical protein ADUPG1_002613 [Aduncisulcus paluster]
MDDFVWIKNQSAGRGLQPMLLGPFQIAEVVSRYKYKVKDLLNKETFSVPHSNMFHVLGSHTLDDLKACRSADTVAWPITLISDHRFVGKKLEVLAHYMDDSEQWLTLKDVLELIPFEIYLLQHPEIFSAVIQSGERPSKKRGRKKK